MGRIRAGAAGPAALDAWDAELARHGVRLMADRARGGGGAAAAVRRARRNSSGFQGRRSCATGRARTPRTPRGWPRSWRERRAADLERGFTAHGPHRDELQLLLGGVALRAYGSQGQQRAALLALLFAERDAAGGAPRLRPPLMLLDDVMSELDAERRELLAGLLRSGGQAVITTTEPDHVPGTALAGGGLIRVEDGALKEATRAVAA